MPISMRMYWIILCVGWLALFGVGETYALINKDMTLTAFVRGISASWPVFVAVMGVTVGALTMHFWGGESFSNLPWHWSLIIFGASIVFGGVIGYTLWTKGAF